jgi:hypothetical protein
MQYHVITLDARQHGSFLEQGRRDPVTKEEFKVGDRVVMCAACRSAFLEGSWRMLGRSHCGQERTLKNLAVDIGRKRFARADAASGATPAPEPVAPVATPGGAAAGAAASKTATPAGAPTTTPPAATTPRRTPPAAAPPASPPPAATPPPAAPPAAAATPPAPATGGAGSKAAGPLKLKNVPVRLANVPISLRPIVPLKKVFE